MSDGNIASDAQCMMNVRFCLQVVVMFDSSFGFNVNNADAKSFEHQRRTVITWATPLVTICGEGHTAAADMVRELTILVKRHLSRRLRHTDT